MTVVVADDRSPFRRSVRTILATSHRFELIAEGSSGEDAVAIADSLKPDVVLMDIKMPGIGGIEATRRITAARPATVVVLLSSYAEADLPAAARACGAAAYVPKKDFGKRVLDEVWSGRRTSASGRPETEAPP